MYLSDPYNGSVVTIRATDICMSPNTVTVQYLSKTAAVSMSATILKIWYITHLLQAIAAVVICYLLL